MIEAWHFVRDDRKLRDGTPLEIGKRLVHDGPLALCKSGYHASEKILDALAYAPGGVVCRVQCDGEIMRYTDKIVCRERTAIWALDATAVLRAFARRCALDVIHLWDAPSVVREYLTTGDESLRSAARAATWAAAMAAASAATWAARDARSAAWAASDASDAACDASDAACDASDAACAARAAAWSAAGADAMNAAWDRYGSWMEEMVAEAHEKGSL